MERKNGPHANLKTQHRKATELGLIGALVLVIGTFQILDTDLATELNIEVGDIEIAVEEVPPTEQMKRPPRPARPSVPIPTDREDVPEEETIEITEIDFENTPPPPPPASDEVDAEGAFQFIPYDEPPVIIGGMAALTAKLEYPELARKAGLEARVIIGCLVSTDGKTEATKIIKASGAKLGFEEAAVAALNQVRWKPAYQRERPVKVWIAIPVRFSLKDATKQPAT